MADEIFRNMDEFTSSDIICSMKEQMTPSDAVVSSLLAKIAACDTSSESFDNTLPFSPVAQDTASVREQKRRTSLKPIWKYGSLAAAGLIVLVSTFALIGDSDSSDFKGLVDNILPDHVVSVPVQDGDDETVNSGDDEDKASNTEANASENSDEENLNSDSLNESDASEKSEEAADSAQNRENGSSSTAPAPTDGTSGDSNGSADTFDREVLASSAASHIAISGTDYVVDTTATSVTTGSKIKAITLKLPQASTSDQTLVNAQIKELDGVSSDLMVALDVDGLDEALVYMNTAYRPSSLGQFIADAGLDVNIGYSSTVYCKGERLGYTSYHRLQVGDINEFVDTYAFANRAATTDKYSAYKNADVHVTFKTASNPTGSVINFGVSDNGYLYVKMSGSKAFTFNIGVSSAEAFIAAVTGE